MPQKFNLKFNGISRKLVTLTLIVSSAVTFCLTVFNVYSDYRVETIEVEKFIEESLNSHREPLELALWNFDEDLVLSQINGFLQLPGVLAAEIESPSLNFKRANSDDSIYAIKQIVLNSPKKLSETTQTIGNLKITIGNGYFINQIKRTIFWIFLTQLFKSALVSFLLLLLFQKHFVRPIQEIEKYFETSKIKNGEDSLPKLIITRKSNSKDEIDTLVEEINHMATNVNQSRDNLKQLNQALEIKVTERTQEVIDSRAKLENSARLSSLGEMSAQIAHEINSPLAVVHAKIQILNSKLIKKGILDFTKDFETIEKSTIRISKIVKSLKVVSRDGTLDQMKKESLNEMLEDIFELITEKLKLKEIDFLFPKLDKNYFILCRKVQIEQVLTNLLNNSFDAIENLAERWIRIEVKELVEQTESILEVQLTDSGPGIPENIYKKIWEPYYTTKEVGKGTGIGLSLSKAMIEEHDATLELDRTQNHTTFIIKFKNYSIRGDVNEAA